MVWTSEQNEAISYEGSDILVAAGAGSGKTSVLTERIIRRILGEKEDDEGNIILTESEGIDCDRLLIVTFTKDAAAEMRSRIYAGLQKRLDAETDEEKTARIYRQQILLSKAKITTIDSFCKSVINENPREAGADGECRVGEISDTELLLDEAVAEACERFGKDNPKEYERLSDIYCEYRSDEKFLETIRKIIEFSRSFADPEGWIKEKCSMFDPFTGGFAGTGWGKWIIENVRTRVYAGLQGLKMYRKEAENLGIESYAGSIEKDIAVTSVLYEEVSKDITWNRLTELLLQTNYDSIAKISKDEKARVPKEISDGIRDGRKAIINDIKKIAGSLVIAESVTEEDRENVADDMKAICTISVDAMNLYSENKRKKGILDFPDLSHLAYRVLTEDDGSGGRRPSEAALRYREQFKEIYIDEYQDTNGIQDEILRLISDPGRGNRFMVGDIKQSIYGFRQAMPEIFLKKYNEYGKPGSGKKLVCLYENFRSRAEVLNSVNSIFSGIMNEKTGGMEYGTREFLNCGATCYENSADSAEGGENPYKTEFLYINTKNAESSVKEEARLIAERIKKLIDSKLSIYDSKIKTDDKESSKTRPVSYKDICILLRYSTHTGELASLLSENGIPVFAGGKGNYFSRPEVNVIISFLEIIDNPLNDIALASVMKNVYGFTDCMLAEISLIQRNEERDLPFFRRVQLAAKEEDGEEKYGPVKYFTDRLDYLRLAARTLPVSETVWTCMNENGFMKTVEAAPGGGISYKNLLRLFSMANAFDAGQGRGLFSFVRNLEALPDTDEGRRFSSAAPDGGTDDVVTVSTVHSSKGLEYPVVIFCFTESKWNTESLKGNFLIHRELGFGPGCYDEPRKVRYPSVMHDAVKMKIDSEFKTEEMRVLYVALTRAREKLIITCADKTPFESFMEKYRKSVDVETKKPLDYCILKAYRNCDFLGMAIEADEMRGDSSFVKSGYEPPEEESDIPENEENTEEYGGEQTFRFVRGIPYMPLVKENGKTGDRSEVHIKTAPQKLTVTEIKRMREAAESVLEEEVPSVVLLEENSGIPDMFADRKDGEYLTGAGLGTLIHTVLEHLDYNRTTADAEEALEYIEELISSLVKENFMTEKEAEAVPKHMFVNYLMSDFAARISKAKRIMREVPFTMFGPFSELTGIISDTEGNTAVQGVMDMIFTKDGRTVLVDFKSDNVFGDIDDYSEKYRVQLSLYAKACKRAFGKKPDEIYLYYIRRGEAVLLDNVQA